MDQKLSQNVVMRVSDEMAERLDKMDTAVGIGRAGILRACLEAALRHFESTGSIRFPIRITDEPEKPDAFSRKK